MGLFTTSADTLNQEVQSMLMPGEQIEQTVKLMEDFLAVTNKRVIFVDAELGSGSSKREIVSIPFSRITEVTLQRGGTMLYAQQISIQAGSIRRKLMIYDKTKPLEIYNLLVQKIV